MADLSLLFPARRSIEIAGAVWDVEQLRLRDLARLESLLADPLHDPLQGRRIELAVALAECRWDCLEQTEAGRNARRKLQSIFHLCDQWTPTLSSSEGHDRLSSPRGQVLFLLVVLERGRPGFGAEEAWAVFQTIFPGDGPIDWEAWQALRSAAYGVDPIEEWSDLVCPERGERPKKTWCQLIGKLLGEPPDPSKLDAIGNLYLSQWRIVASGGEWSPGKEMKSDKDDELMESRERMLRKRIVLAEPGGNGVVK